MVHKSPRGFILSWIGEVKSPILTVEIYMKWYSLFLINPDNIIEEISFPYYDDLPNNEPNYMDHVPNPVAVEKLCKEKNWELDDVTKELLVGRWEIDYKENYFNEIIE